MSLNVGGVDASAVYVGSTPASGVYLGSQQIWSAGPGVPTFKAAANNLVGLSGGAVSSANLSWPQTGASLGAHGAALVGIMAIGTPTGTPAYPADFTSAVTYGGTAMTKLGGAYHYLAGSEWSWTELWGLLTPPAGDKTVAVHVDEAIATRLALMGGSALYSHVGSFGTVVTNHGAAVSTASVTATSATGNLAFVVFGGGAGYSGNFTGFNYTQRVNNPTGGSGGLLLGEAPGAASVPFGVNTTTYEWEAVAVDLVAA